MSGSVEVPAYGSVILLNCECNSDGACNNFETASTCPSDCH
ncbi:hypothetical protein [Archangium minus]